MRPRLIATSFCLASIALACAHEPAAEIEPDRLTVGTVQREIKIGMDSASVIEALGSPNMVTTDDQRREQWVYDKVSTDRVDTANSSYATLIILGTSAAKSSSAQRQRTLTIVIKFDEDHKVRDFAYNYTQF